LHEHGLGDLILHDLEPRFSSVPAGGCLQVRVRASEISGLSQEVLQQALDHSQEHHGTPPVRLELVSDALLGRCAACGTVTRVNDDLSCGVCKSSAVTLCAGETILIEEVTVCPPAAGGGDR
jgi:Zn finger protein HypA/HybF involved in hydrogenase expression